MDQQVPRTTNVCGTDCRVSQLVVICSSKRPCSRVQKSRIFWNTLVSLDISYARVVPYLYRHQLDAPLSFVSIYDAQADFGACRFLCWLCSENLQEHSTNAAYDVEGSAAWSCVVAQAALPCTASSSTTKVADSEMRMKTTRDKSESDHLEKIDMGPNSKANSRTPELISAYDSQSFIWLLQNR